MRTAGDGAVSSLQEGVQCIRTVIARRGIVSVLIAFINVLSSGFVCLFLHYLFVF